MAEEFVELLSLVLHYQSRETLDWVHDQVDEGALESCAVLSLWSLTPLLGWSIEELITPKTAHHLVDVDVHLLGVELGELMDGEGPSHLSGTEGGVSLTWVDLDVSESLVLVGRDDDVGVLYNTTEALVHGLGVELTLE